MTSLNILRINVGTCPCFGCGNRNVVQHYLSPCPYSFDLLWHNRTNIYNVQTDVSGTDSSMKTTITSTLEFARSQRKERSLAVAASASFAVDGFFVEAAASVSASADEEQNNLMASTGAQSFDSELFTSIAVSRVASVSIEQFEKRYSFVTFNEAFGNFLTAYRDALEEPIRSKKIAYDIIEAYGQFVVERALYGGYLQVRTTLAKSSLGMSLATEEDKKKCYEASVSASASGGAYSGSFSAETSGCDAEAKATFEAANNSYQSDTSEQSFVGGTVVDGKLTVEPGQGVLLKEKNKYPAGDNGVEFRLLSEFLDPLKINPLEVRKWQITPEQFDRLRESLQGHILEYFLDFSNILDNCDCGTAVPFIQKDLSCKCYGGTDAPSFRFAKSNEEWMIIVSESGRHADHVPDGGNPGGAITSGRVEKSGNTGPKDVPYFNLGSNFADGQYVYGCTLSFDLKLENDVGDCSLKALAGAVSNVAIEVDNGVPIIGGFLESDIYNNPRFEFGPGLQKPDCAWTTYSVDMDENYVDPSQQTPKGIWRNGAFAYKDAPIFGRVNIYDVITPLPLWSEAEFRKKCIGPNQIRIFINMDGPFVAYLDNVQFSNCPFIG